MSSRMLLISAFVGLTTKRTPETFGYTAESPTSEVRRTVIAGGSIRTRVILVVGSFFTGKAFGAARAVKRILTKFSCTVRESLGLTGCFLCSNLLSPHSRVTTLLSKKFFMSSRFSDCALM
jgi:hypothetical protein